MKSHRLLILTPLLFGFAASASLADCNPPCRGNKVCRYDSTHNPQFYCKKPPVASATSAQTTRGRENSIEALKAGQTPPVAKKSPAKGVGASKGQFTSKMSNDHQPIEC